MTILNRVLNERLTNLQTCVEKAPEGLFQEGRNAAFAVDTAIEQVRETIRNMGFKVDNCDRCRDLEAAIYGYILQSNPNHTGLAAAEGFGEHVDGPAGARITEQLLQDKRFIRAMKGNAA